MYFGYSLDVKYFVFWLFGEVQFHLYWHLDCDFYVETHTIVTYNTPKKYNKCYVFLKFTSLEISNFRWAELCGVVKLRWLWKVCAIGDILYIFTFVDFSSKHVRGNMSVSKYHFNHNQRQPYSSPKCTRENAVKGRGFSSRHKL